MFSRLNTISIPAAWAKLWSTIDVANWSEHNWSFRIQFILTSNKYDRISILYEHGRSTSRNVTGRSLLVHIMWQLSLIPADFRTNLVLVILSKLPLSILNLSLIWTSLSIFPPCSCSKVVSTLSPHLRKKFIGCIDVKFPLLKNFCKLFDN